MSDLARLVVLLVLAGVVLTAFGGAMIWYMEEGRRLRRALTNVLGAAEGVLLAPGTGRGTAFAFANHQMAVAWDMGAWCLVYSLDELVGAELVADGEVLGRVHRGEQRRALDRAPREANEITLRILFDDPAHPDFLLTLWDAQTPKRDGGPATPAGAVQEANRWLARAEAILRRQGAVKSPSNAAAATAAAAAAGAAGMPRPPRPLPPPAPAPPPTPVHTNRRDDHVDDDDDFDDPPPLAHDRRRDQDLEDDDEDLDEEPPF